MRELKLMDWTHGNIFVAKPNSLVSTGIDLDDIDEIEEIYISVVTGDEIAHIEYVGGRQEIFDSSETRNTDYYDGGFTLYNKTDGINLIDKFINRKSSYDFEDWEDEK